MHYYIFLILSNSINLQTLNSQGSTSWSVSEIIFTMSTCLTRLLCSAHRYLGEICLPMTKVHIQILSRVDILLCVKHYLFICNSRKVITHLAIGRITLEKYFNNRSSINYSLGDDVTTVTVTDVVSSYPVTESSCPRKDCRNGKIEPGNTSHTLL